MKNDDHKVSKNKEKKQAIIAKLSEKAEKAKALVFTNYTGMTHKQLEALKKALKAANAEIVVAKNTLLKRALEKSQKQNQEDIDSALHNPTATLFAFDDPIPALREIAKSIKNLKLPTIKLGIFDGKVLAEKDVVRLSTLPSRDVLLAQLVGGLKSPLFGLHRTLSWNLTKLVMTLKAIESKKA